MGRYLDFEKEEKGFKPFYLSRENIRANIGKTICYVNRVDPHRGYYNVYFGVIHSVRYSTLYLNDGEHEIDVRDVKECGIKITDENE